MFAFRIFALDLSILIPAEPPPPGVVAVTSDSSPSSVRTLSFEKGTINT